jgi:hypothetical protein
MIDRHWDGIAAYCRPENKVSLGFVEGLNNKIRVTAPGLRLSRRAISAAENSHLHAAPALTLTRFETPRIRPVSILTTDEQIKSRHLRAGVALSLWT